MKTIKQIALLLIFSLTFVACSDSDTPEVVVEEEVITTMNITLTPDGDGEVITISSQDLDGDGPTAPEITGGTLVANTTYNATIALLNETESPAEDITEEIDELADEHQFFFAESGLSTTFSYSDEDADGYPVGLSFSITTADSATGTITVTLRHEPTKSADGVSTGDITNAGGSTDIEVSFPITVQ